MRGGGEGGGRKNLKYLLLINAKGVLSIFVNTYNYLLLLLIKVPLRYCTRKDYFV